MDGARPSRILSGALRTEEGSSAPKSKMAAPGPATFSSTYGFSRTDPALAT